MTVDEALELIELEWAIDVPFGASELGRVARFLIVIRRLRDDICPKLTEFYESLSTTESALVAVLIDILGPLATKSPLVVGTLFREITKYGIEKFCSNPSGIIVDQADQA